jgi:pyridoxal phosphate enzyme (YggS family)
MLEVAEGASATLVAVSKTKTVADILELYHAGHRHFGENYVQELCEKRSKLPEDIHWHFIGHLQRNKVKMLVPFVHLIQGVDSELLLLEIQKQAAAHDRVIDCLLQVFIATEETKFGMNESELQNALQVASTLTHVRIRGLMGMASFTDDKDKVLDEFQYLKRLFDTCKVSREFNTLSMGMSADYNLALNAGSNMIRVGSLLFGQR